MTMAPPLGRCSLGVWPRVALHQERPSPGGNRPPGRARGCTGRNVGLLAVQLS